MAIHEECGVFGIYAPFEKEVASVVYYGLYALQHRGQESCGISVNCKGNHYSHKDLGLVADVFKQETLNQLPKGKMAIGHVRYGTTGATVRANCQPMEVNHHKGRLSLAHNGNIANALKLRDELEMQGAIFHSTSDTETIAYIITRERIKAGSIEMAVSKMMDVLEGAYSLVMMSSTKMIALRDPYGFRPLCYGIMEDGSYVVASESCALDAVGAKFVRDLLPGEMLVFKHDRILVDRSHCYIQRKKTCVFEYIYFARPDSLMDGISVHEARVKAGEILAREYPVEADVVMGVPDSGLDAALGYARYSGIPYEIGLIKNKYIGRTFISPTQDQRMNQVKIKLNPVRQVVAGKRIVLVDDSIVRGTTSQRIVALLREFGAKEIHMRISAPPFRFPCYYGTDVDSKENLIANKMSVEEIGKMIGVDSLGYLPMESLGEMVGNEAICKACFDGRYPTAIPEDNRKDKFE
ncbi:MAG: amidophosphoribosyltransferase [Erysipelotrichaceae bacterium]|nr:amidophosphoribosyltransferase [Erysipelotrichaceae bacterium]